MTYSIEEITLSKLILDYEYTRKVLPFIKDEYFDTLPNRILFNTFDEYVKEYTVNPEPNALKLEVEKRRDITDEIYREVVSFLDNLDETTTTKIGCLIPLRSGVRRERFIWHSWSL